MDEGGEWKHGVRLDLRSRRRIKLQFQWVGARPWIIERQSVLVRVFIDVSWMMIDLRGSKFSHRFSRA